MPCEKCNVKFGLLTRKKSCYECRRLFCRDCLSKREERFLCPNCTIFTKRPLSRIDLAQLKVKDLILYLQSKHISTTGCVEKDDLINLVIAHVNSGGSSPRTPGAFSGSSSTTGSASGGSSRYGSFSQNGAKNYSNTFDQIKNTCQNLFSTFSDKFNGDVPVGSRNDRPFEGPTRANDSFSQQENHPGIYTQPRFGSNNVYHQEAGATTNVRHDGMAGTATGTANQRTTAGEGERPNAQSARVGRESGHNNSATSSSNNSVSGSGTTSSADSSAASSSFSSPIRESVQAVPSAAPPTADSSNTSQAALNDRIESILALESNANGCECCTDDEDDGHGQGEAAVGPEVTRATPDASPTHGGDKSDEEMVPRRSKLSRRSLSHASLLPSPEPSAGPTEGEVLSDGGPSPVADPRKAAPPRSRTPSSSTSFDELLPVATTVTATEEERSSSNADDHAIADGGDTLATVTAAVTAALGNTTTDTDADAQMTTAGSMDDTDQWQIINTSDANGATVGAAGTEGEAVAMLVDQNDTTTATIYDAEEESSDSLSPAEPVKCNARNAQSTATASNESPIHPQLPSVVTRRRSDSFLLSFAHSKTQRPVGVGATQLFGHPSFTLRAGPASEIGISGNAGAGGGGSVGVVRLPPGLSGTFSTDAIPSSSHPANHTSMCFRCGKRRNGIRRQLKKFRRQLEAATGASEAEKRRQLEAFLNYLERRSKGSFELTDSESITEEASISLAEETTSPGATRPSDEGAAAVAAASAETAPSGPGVPGAHGQLSTDDGAICVNLYSSGNQQLVNMKQINLSDIKESADLDVLSVKQLKGILMVNRVDFKGCCEKAELRERVLRLWRDFKSIPSIEKLTSDDLCKICMDAPIECVILECGHMTTCTACGKVLTECPICRQYIVRVVRFFRA